MLLAYPFFPDDIPIQLAITFLLFGFALIGISWITNFRQLRLKRTGELYLADIRGFRVVSPPRMKIYVMGIFDCTYTCKKGDVHWVESKPIMSHEMESGLGLIAHVYVDPRNPDNYAVEILRPNKKKGRKPND